MNLNQIGWNEYFEESFKTYSQMGYSAGRISAEFKNVYKVYTEFGEIMAEVSGKYRFDHSATQGFPAVGDWVVLSPRVDEMAATIHAILPRKSKFSRKVAWVETAEQIVASNVDNVFIVTALNQNFNLRRIERYLTLAWESGAEPVIILSKADLCEDIGKKIIEVESIADGVPIHAVSTVKKEGIDELNQYLSEGNTIVLLGSSGVGKSTLVNELMGEKIQEVKDISRINGKGRHTTTSRELLVLPSGALLIDTPGMRELQLWDGADGITGAFEDIESIAAGCRFSDCTHEGEPGCEVQRALEDGRLSSERVRSYIKLLREIKCFERRQNGMAKLSQKRLSKSTGKNEKKSKDYRKNEMEVW